MPRVLSVMSFSPFRFPVLEPVLSIVLMFALTQALALLAGVLLISAAVQNPVVNTVSVAPIQAEPENPLNAVFFIAYVLAGAAAALIAIRFFRGRLAFRLLEFVVLTGSVSMLFFAFLVGLAHADFLLAIGLSGAAGLLFALVKFFFKGLKNTAAILSSAGVGALLGFSMGFWPALLFIAAISLYDYIAVFKTRHMLALAQHLGARELSFTITAEKKEEKKEEKKSDEEKREKEKIGLANPEPPRLSSSSPSSAKSSPSPLPPSPSSAPSSGVERLDLGSGDLAIPAMLAVSTYGAAGLGGSLAIALGSTVSLYVLLKFVLEKRVALPALPPICMGALCALLIFLLARIVV